MPAMGMVTAGAIIGGAVLGGISASKGRKAAQQAAAKAYEELAKLGLPPDLSREIILQKYEEMGMLTPELEQDIDLQASEVSKIQEDPSLRTAQMESLNTLAQVSRGGLRAEDRSAFNELRAATARDSEAKRQQILQGMMSRGMGGSGADLMAQLQSSQAAEDTASAQSDRLAAQASVNALNALNQKAQLSGNIRGQDFDVNQTRAQALDDRNQFLYQNSVARQRNNISALNQAQQANLANRQRVSEMNTQQANQELQRQNEAKRDYWQDQFGLATAKANALNNQGTVVQAGENKKAAMYTGVGNALGQAATAYGAYQNNKPAETNYFSGNELNSAIKYDANGNRIS